MERSEAKAKAKAEFYELKRMIAVKSKGYEMLKSHDSFISDYMRLVAHIMRLMRDNFHHIAPETSEYFDELMDLCKDFGIDQTLRDFWYKIDFKVQGHRHLTKIQSFVYGMHLCRKRNIEKAVFKDLPMEILKKIFWISESI